MSLMKRHYYNSFDTERKENFIYLFILIFCIFIINKLIDMYFLFLIDDNIFLTISVGIFIVSVLISYYILIRIKQLIHKLYSTYDHSLNNEKDRLIPYEFALNNSVDAIYLFTLDAKFVYVNDAACKMLGYRKDELIGKYLELMDPNFTRITAPLIMEEIKNTPNWRLETTQRKKSGDLFDIEMSGHGFYHQGQVLICTFGRDMTKRLEYRAEIINMNTELQESLHEKEILLKEVHHRVKNNMEIISSLLSMQLRRAKDEDIKYILKQSKSRINTMALVHEFLYLGETFANINIHEYIERLIQDIKELYISKNTKLEIDLNIDDLVFSANRCIQIGMVLHELCVNALKYAFKENRENLLCIHMKEENDNFHIKIRDNGDGLEDINSLYKTNSIGMQLINSIVDNQLEGTLEFKNNNGLECNIIFLKEESEQ